MDSPSVCPPSYRNMPQKLAELERENLELKTTVKEQEGKIEYMSVMADAERSLYQTHALRVDQQAKQILVLESQLKQMDEERVGMIQKMERFRRELVKFTSGPSPSPVIPGPPMGGLVKPELLPVPFTPQMEPSVLPSPEAPMKEIFPFSMTPGDAPQQSQLQQLQQLAQPQQAQLQLLQQLQPQPPANVDRAFQFLSTLTDPSGRPRTKTC